MDFHDYNALGQVIDTTFGRASTSGVHSHSIKATVIGENKIKVVYSCIVNLTTDREAQQMKQRYSEESDSIIKKYVTSLKKNFKEATKKSLSLKEYRSDSSLEMIDMNIYNRKRTSIFRRTVLFDIDA